MSRPLALRLAAQHHTCRTLEHAADAEWIRVRRYVDSYGARPRAFPSWVLRRSERWWRLQVDASIARDRLHVLLQQWEDQVAAEEGVRLVHLERTPLAPSSSWGGSGERRVAAPPTDFKAGAEEATSPHHKGDDAAAVEQAAEPGAPAAKSGGALPPSTPAAAFPGGNPAPSPIRGSGAPPPLEDLQPGSTSSEAASVPPGRGSAAPPLRTIQHGAGDCAVCSFVAGHVSGLVLA